MAKNVIQLERPTQSNMIVAGHLFAAIREYNLTGDKSSLDYIVMKIEEKLGIRPRQELKNYAMDLGNYCEPFVAESISEKYKKKGYGWLGNVAINLAKGGYIDLLMILIKGTDENNQPLFDVQGKGNHCFEIKCKTTAKGWQEVLKEADSKHLAQLAFYMVLTNTQEGTLVYFNAAQQGETKSETAYLNREKLDFTFDTEEKNYKTYKIKLEGKGKNTARAIVADYIDGEHSITADKVIEWVNNKTMPPFYAPNIDQQGEFWAAYNQNESVIETLEAQIKALKTQLESAEEVRTGFNNQIIQLMDDNNVPVIVTNTRVITLPERAPKFDSGEFKKAHAEEYAACQVNKKTFDAKVAQENYPELVALFTTLEIKGTKKLVTQRQNPIE